MKRSALCLSVILFLNCSKLPFGPGIRLEPSAVIEHLGTEYVDADSTVNGLITTKVNILSFGIKSVNFRPKALEFYGRAIIHGPPENRVYAIHFRTDSVALNSTIAGFTFNIEEWIDPGSTYTLIRPKFPTNEYSPFQGLQGKVKEVSITEAWAFDENGNRFSVALSDTVSN